MEPVPLPLPRNDRRRAAALILCAMAIIGGIDTLVARIADHVGLWQFHAVRAAMAVPVLILASLIFGWRLWPRRPWVVLARAVSSTLAMLVYFGCLAILPIGQVAAGLFTSPIFILIFSAVLLGERIGPRRILAVVIGFAGILLILRPWDGELSAVGLVPVLAGALYSCSVMMTRHWCAQEAPTTLLLWFFVVLGSAGAGGAIFFTWIGNPGETAFALRPWVAAPGAEFWLFTGLQAAGALVGVSMLVRGYQIAVPSQVAPFEYALLVFAPLWAFFLWGEALGPFILAGMVLIFVAGLILSRSQPG